MRKPVRLFWRLYPSYLIITVLAILAVSLYTYRSVQTFFMDQLSLDLQARAKLVQGQILDALNPPDGALVDRVCKQSGRQSGTRITVILPSGAVLGDSGEEPEKMDNHANRPEVRDALAGRAGTAIRFSATLQKRMMYVAVPIMSGETVRAVIRTSIPVDLVDRSLRRLSYHHIIAGLVIALLAAAVSLLVSRRITRPIEELRAGTEEFAKGNLRYRLPVPRSLEMQLLARAMTRMARDLDERIQTIDRQRNELEAVLSSMREGVIALDTGERLIKINQAAARLFKWRPRDAVGRTIQEVIRTPDLHRFVKDALAAGDPKEAEISVHMDEERILNAHSSALRDAEGKLIGTLIVFHDITELRRLETIRREFAANVSHEIKTPLTAIKGFVETLLNGAVRRPEEAERFLAIIDKHADRLTAIIEDLMKLSEIEQKGQNQGIPLESGPIRNVIVAAMEVCRLKAREKGIALELDVDPTLTADMNAHFLEQAMVNLIDNAVKYGRENSAVRISGAVQGDEVVVRIADQGIGIPRSHLPRLFERFYRVDKSRSRKMGGTGLGLAIVKHIVQGHGGRVTVESALGEGSTFSVHLPLPSA